jgi:hypothetical protein
MAKTAAFKVKRRQIIIVLFFVTLVPTVDSPVAVYYCTLFYLSQLLPQGKTYPFKQKLLIKTNTNEDETILPIHFTLLTLCWYYTKYNDL